MPRFFLLRVISPRSALWWAILKRSILTRKNKSVVGVTWICFSWFFGTSGTRTSHYWVLKKHSVASGQVISLTVLMFGVKSRSGSSVCQSSRSSQSPARRLLNMIWYYMYSYSVEPCKKDRMKILLPPTLFEDFWLFCFLQLIFDSIGNQFFWIYRLLCRSYHMQLW